MSFKLQRYNRLRNSPAVQQQRPKAQHYSIKPAVPLEQPGDSILGHELASASFAVVQPNAVVDEAARTSSASFWGMAIILSSAVIWGAGMIIGFEAALGILMGLCLVLAVVGLIVPSLGILAVGCLAGLDAVATELLLTGGLLRYNTLNYWLILTAFLFLPFVLRLRDLNTRTIQLFLLLLTLELSFSQNLTHGVQDVLNIAATFGMVVYFARALKDEQSLYWLGVVNGFVAGLGGLIFVLQIRQLPYANPNNWTFFQLTALFSICISFPYARILHKSRLILIILALVNIAWIFISGSRGSLLIALLCLVYIFLSTRSFTWSSVLIALTFLGAAWFSTLFFEQQSFMISRIQLLFDPTQTETKRTSKRSALAEAGLAIFRQNPLGIGTGSFREEASNTNLISGNRPAHSAWIKTLAENGVPGILLMALFIGSFAIVGLKKHQEGKLLFGLFIAIVFASAFVAKEFRGKSLWFLAASGIVLLHPEEILSYLNIKQKLSHLDYRTRLREIRFGNKK